MTPDLKSLDIKTDWKCVYMSSFLAFVTTVQSNLFFSSLSPYLVKIDDQATQSFFGYVIASYSIGQFFGVPIFGYLSNRIKQFKVPLIACIVFTLIGNLLHIGLELSSQNRRYLLLIARISTGFGAGVSSLVFAYIAIVSSNADRPRAIAMVTLANSMGFILGPLFQAIFSIFDYPGHALFGIFHLNLYTIPAYIALAINSMAIFVIQYWFCDKKTLDEKEILCCDSSSESSVTSSSIHSNYKPDKIAIFVMNFTRFCQLFVHAHIETISTNFTMIMFGWTSQEAVRNVALYQLFHGVLSMIFNLVYISCHLDRL
uniref:MFS domain-containing protein n=1 Tax=Rhabditophanes sp. KR3021 TaxID=114890 RepID=A0AC35TG75_9BILA